MPESADAVAEAPTAESGRPQFALKTGSLNPSDLSDRHARTSIFPARMFELK